MIVKNTARYIAFLSSVLLLFSCNVKEDAEVQFEDFVITETGERIPASSFETGHVRVYLSKDFNETRIGVTTKSDGVCSVIEMEEFREITEELGVYRMERTFPYAGEFEERTRAAGLDRWYDIYFDADCPISEYLGKLDAVEVIECSELRPKMVKMFTDDVTYVTPSVVPSAAGLPFDDPLLSSQWHYYNTGERQSSVKGCDINVVPVWQAITTGRPDVIVAVVDSGVSYDHEDLAANMWENPDPLVTGAASHGFNFINNSFGINPSRHGTHVAGTIAAVNNNGLGVSGIAGGDYAAGKPSAKIMSCQILDDEDGNGSSANAIKWACDHGAVICQNSWGYEKIKYIPPSDRAAIDYFNTYAGFDAAGNQTGPMAGGLVVFSSGNDNRSEGYPAMYEGVMAVASVGADFVRAYYSNFGDWVDITAPGGDAQKGNQIYSTLPGNKYGLMQGTSMACPHVSGVAALVVSAFGGPGFTRDMLWNRLVNNAKSLKNYNMVEMGGLVDALASCASFGVIAPDKVTEFSAEPLKSNYVRFSVKVPADEDDGQAFGVNIYYSTDPIESTAAIPYKSFPFGGLSAGEVYSDTLSGVAFSTKYYLRAEAYDLSGNRSALSDPVQVITSDNSAPEIKIVSGDLKCDVRAHETKYIVFSYSDADGHTMFPFLTTDSEADTLLVSSNTGQIAIIGKNDKPGTYFSTIEVKDEFDAVSSFSYTFTIYENHAPFVKGEMPDILFNSIAETKSFNVSDFIDDEDGEILRYSATDDGNGVVSVSVSKGLIHVTSLKAGFANVTLNAVDEAGDAVSISFAVLVRKGGDPLDIYPVPVKTTLNIRTGESLEDAYIVVSTQTGKVIYDGHQTASAFQPAVVDMKDCAPGSYVVRVEYGGNVYTKTIVKI